MAQDLEQQPIDFRKSSCSGSLRITLAISLAFNYTCLSRNSNRNARVFVVFLEDFARTDGREGRAQGYTSYTCSLHAAYVSVVPTGEGGRLRSPKFVWRPHYFVYQNEA